MLHGRKAARKNGVNRRSRGARRWQFVVALALIAGAGLVLKAVHDTGAFELDGNAIATTLDDWDKVVAGTSTATATSFTEDKLASGPNAGQAALNATIFTGGGSKDPIDINQWAWKDDANGPPDKDNLLHSFAARYSLPPTDPANPPPAGSPVCFNGTGGPGQPTFNPNLKCEVIFFGSDRYDNSGDATQAFWFFQNEIGLGSNPVGGGSGFTGVHKPGDLLVISDFSNGGGTSTIIVLKWDPVCTATNKPDGSCADANLRRLASSTAANCASATGADAFCGIVNPNNGTTAPWTFLDKSGNSTYLNGEFYEGGVNLSLLGLAGECFASISSETRSSTSTTAVLKDFVLGSFARCNSGIQTTPQSFNTQTQAGTDITGTLSIGTGTVAVRDKAVVTISGKASWSGTIDFSLCGPGDLFPTPGKTQTTCETGGTLIGDDVAVSGGLTPATVFSPVATVTSVGKYCWRAEFTSSTPGVPSATDSALTECFTVDPVGPALTTDATADPGTGVSLGTAVSDTATLSGAASQPANPVINTTGAAGAAAGGTITFKLYGPSATPVCSDPVNGIGGNLVFTTTRTVSGNGAYTSAGFAPTAAGRYYWVASYTGNLPNTTGPITGGCGDTNEVSVINPNPTSITTNASGANGVPLGTAITDSATLSGATATAGGTITFNVYGPNNTGCTGTAAFTSTVNVSGPGQYSSGSFTPTQSGTYRWIASYSGDANNQASSGACNDANEASLITDIAVATSQFFYPNDTATITATGGTNLQGTIRFRVYTTNNCAAASLVYDSGALSATTASGVLTKTVSTTNTTNSVSGNVTVYWIVDFDSTNSQHADVSLACGTERATITVVDKQ